MTVLDSVEELNTILGHWEDEAGSALDPLPTLTRVAELMEKETEAYLKMDPDPFDDRHPGRTDPNCTFGHLLKALFKNDNFMGKLVNNYLLHHGNRELNTAAARLLLDIMPGLETSVVFQETEGLVLKLYQWAESAHEPLRSYSSGLLAAAMELQDVAGNFRENNAHLIPIMLQRLHELSREDLADANCPISGDCKSVVTDESSRPFAHLNGETMKSPQKMETMDCDDKMAEGDDKTEVIGSSLRSKIKQQRTDTPGFSRPTTPITTSLSGSRGGGLSTPARKKPSSLASNASNSQCDGSNSSWAEMEQFVIGSHQMYPLTRAMQQRLTLQYLTAMGEYQEMLVYVFEHNSLNLILHYISLKENKDVRLAFEALKYLAALLCHKKFAIEFVQVGGLQRLLEVRRPSIAATGVSMCLYYLAYSEDALERVCLLQNHVLSELVRYALWLLECSHESSRCHATMFFSLSFQFRAILELFDQQDGLRKLYNMVSTLPMLSSDEPNSASSSATPAGAAAAANATPRAITDDEVFGNRQTARQVCNALKRYYEVHLALKAEQLRRSHSRNQGLYSAPSPSSVVLPYKAAKFTQEMIQQNIETLLELLPLRASWPPVDELHHLSGINLLLQLVSMAYDWNYSGRGEMVKSALDVLSICSVVPKTQLIFCEPVTVIDSPTVVGLGILLGAAEGEVVPDPEVQKSALNVIINCVCSPTARLGGYVGRIISGNAKKRMAIKSGEDFVGKMWTCVRSNNGIMALLNLLNIKTPITDADVIRALACKALVGLARSETVKQIISKLPLFTNGQLQVLMREPVLQDNRSQHVKFCHFAMELIERVTGKPLSTGVESSIAKINKADVVAQTKIVYSEKELLQLIHQHLINKGLNESAMALQREAILPSTTQRMTPSSRLQYQLVMTNKTARNAIGHSTTVQHSPTVHPSPTVHLVPTSSGTPLRVIYNNPHHARGSANRGSLAATTQLPASRGASPQAAHGTLARTLAVTNGNSGGSSGGSSGGGSSSGQQQRGTATLQKSQMSCGDYQQSPIMKRQNLTSVFRQQSSPGPSTTSPVVSLLSGGSTTTASVSSPVSTVNNGHVVTLDSIVTEYLRKQHAICKNPVVTCPPFDLFIPHKCPDPKFRNSAPTNVTARLQSRMIFPRVGGVDGAKRDRNFLYSRFRPSRTYRDVDDSYCFTCCAFSACEQYLIFGTSSGQLQLYNVDSGQKEYHFSCHSSSLNNCEPSRDGKLILTSSTWRRPLSALWALNDTCELMHPFDEDCYVEFSKWSQDRIIGTRDDYSVIYDVATGAVVLTLKDAEMANRYTQNRATFAPTDELVLSDGVIWDVSSGKPVHKFDKFNPKISGVFHPNGLEIVSNSEIWDIRTFHLLHTVPALDQCQITFNHKGDVIYGAISEEEGDLGEEQVKSPFGSSFRTFDATDYSNIATIDIKKNIFDLCTDKSDCYLAIVENQGPKEGYSYESICRLYEVGRYRADDDDEGEDEEEEDEPDNDEDGSDDGSGDDAGDSDDFDVREDYDEQYSISTDSSSSSGDDDDDDDSNMNEIAIDEDGVDVDDDDDDDDDVLFSINE